jgi:hypothetical protein
VIVRHRIHAVALLAGLCSPLSVAIAAPAPLLPADSARTTLEYVVLNHGRPAGEMQIERSTGETTVRYAHVDRNRGRWIWNRYEFDANGRVSAAESRALARDGRRALILGEQL